jgi:hypothetical protein
MKVRVHGARPWRSAIGGIFLMALAACGGSGGNGTSAEPNQPPGGVAPPETAVTPTVDATLVSGSSLRIAKTLSAREVKSSGQSVAVGAGAAVYGLDGNDDVALVTTSDGSTAVFSADSTARVIAVKLLQQAYRQTPAASLGNAVTATAGYSDLVAAINAVARSGANPLKDSEVRRLFRVVVTNAAARLSAASSSSAAASSERANRLAVAPNRVDQSLEPVLRPTPFGRISLLATGAISGSVQLRNTSSVPFTATLLDDAGVARGGEPLPTGGLLDQVAALTDPVPVAKSFEGAFSVRLKPDVQAAYRALLKNLLEALILSLASEGAFVPTCGKRLAAAS